MARKPLIGTVAANVLEHGTGGLNIDECRVAGTPRKWDVPRGGFFQSTKTPSQSIGASDNGRWPANLLHDGSDEVVEMFPQTKPSKATPRNNGEFKSVAKGRDLPHVTYGHEDNGGSAARFFASFTDLEQETNCRIKYCAKASKRERGEGNHHPTVKPIALMEYLVKLASREGAIVLDPFMGSGTTGIACANLGRKFIGIERDPEYFRIAEARIDNAKALF